MKIKDLPKVDRPREKLFEKGSSALKDSELLAIILRTGYKGKNVVEMSSKILRNYPVEKLVKLSLQELIKVKGIGRTKASQITAAFELAKRAFNKDSEPAIESAKDIAKIFSNLRNNQKEYLVVVCLNARNQVIHHEVISIGSLNSNSIHPREAFQAAIQKFAAGVIFVHNHPSGNSEPSDADLIMTKRLIDAGKIIGIEVLDHVIIGKTFKSLKESGLI